MSDAGAKFSATTATSIVVANMIGTGVFTSLGFQLIDIDSAPVILGLWLLGGILALCGALCYSELSTSLPRSGGEYNFLAELYHPGVGFVAGWVSATIGFAAPTALAAITSATYLRAVLPEVNATLAAVVLVLVVALAHLGTRRNSARFQLVFTSIKVVLIMAFIFLAWGFAADFQPVRWIPQAEDLALVGSGGFAIALIYVNYAYTGWNAATYVAGEIADPQRSLPRVLLVGTGLVAGLYLALHVVFLSIAPMAALRGQLEVGYIVASYAFGEFGSQAVGIMLSVLLVSTVSAMVLAGPRALQVIGQDYRMLRVLSRENRYGIPYVAICFQTAVTILLIVTSTFEVILVFSSFTLALNTLLAVLGVVVLRRRGGVRPGAFRVPWYPGPVVVYVAITGWTLVYVVLERPTEGAFGALLVATGWLFYLLTRDRVRQFENPTEEREP